MIFDIIFSDGLHWAIFILEEHLCTYGTLSPLEDDEWVLFTYSSKDKQQILLREDTVSFQQVGIQQLHLDQTVIVRKESSEIGFLAKIAEISNNTVQVIQKSNNKSSSSDKPFITSVCNIYCPPTKYIQMAKYIPRLPNNVYQILSKQKSTLGRFRSGASEWKPLENLLVNTKTPNLSTIRFGRKDIMHVRLGMYYTKGGKGKETRKTKNFPTVTCSYAGYLKYSYCFLGKFNPDTEKKIVAEYQAQDYPYRQVLLPPTLSPPFPLLSLLLYFSF